MTWRASQLEKMNVRNRAGEKIGAIEDLVITADGRVAYAALGFGGFLGMGEKLFAVPWKDIHMHVADANSNENYIMLNVTKEELKSAPGFDKDKWPNFADPNFTNMIDQYYQTHRAEHNKVGQR
jgi:sporulation protein YlmC with PRC-barrel domain